MRKFTRNPYFPGVCEEVARSSEGFFKRSARFEHAFHQLGESKLLRLTCFDLGFVGCNQRVTIGVYYAVHKLGDLGVERCPLSAHPFGIVLCGAAAKVPKILDHNPRHFEQARQRLKRAQKRFEGIVDRLTSDRLAMRWASLRVAPVVWVALVTPFGPSGGHWVATARAGDKVPQREIFMQVLAIRRVRPSGKAIQNALVRRKVDQRFVLAGMEMEPPMFDSDAASAENAFEDIAR